jgi:hypothetical protein
MHPSGYKHASLISHGGSIALHAFQVEIAVKKTCDLRGRKKIGLRPARGFD